MRRAIPTPSRPTLPQKRTGATGSLTARAFTLTELMVSVGILAGMMTMVAMIFSTATKASGQAQATTVIYRQLLQITEGLRRDLAAMDPAATDSTAVLGIARVDVLAYETPEDGATGRALITNLADPDNDYHRADVLMLVTKRKFEPYVYEGGTDDQFASVRHVIYGHANFAELKPNGTWLAGSDRAIEGDPRSVIPASQWHLARRIVGFPSGAFLMSSRGLAGWPLDLGKASMMGGSTALGAFSGSLNDPGWLADVYEQSWSAFETKIWAGHFQYDDAGLRFYYTTPGGEVFRYGAAAGEPPSTDYFFLEDGYWYKYDSVGWTRTDPFGSHSPTSSPTLLLASAFNTKDNERYWPEWFYVNGGSRVVLDPTPPVGQGRRLAHYFLPACSEFKVEFTYDDPREIEIDRDPDSPNFSEPILFEWYDTDNNGTVDSVPAPRPIRWESVPAGEKWVWSRLSTQPDNYEDADGDLRDLTHPYRWPKAIRITIRVYDPGGRLEEPVTQTIVHAW